MARIVTKTRPRKAASTRIAGVTRRIVAPTEWRRACAAITAKEKAHMRRGDAIAAARRRMPWMKMGTHHVFEGPRGRLKLVDLFEGRTQLVLYHFMFGPKVNGWPDYGCVGCSFVADQICHLDHVHARDITFAMTSAVPYADIARLRARMGWERLPWYSGTEEFNADCDVADRLGNSFGLNVFCRDGADVYRTHFVARRGIEAFGTAWTFYDLTPLGRQEEWQDVPAGSPQGAPYGWWRRHGMYDAGTGSA
ncbi:MAG: DUF899 family protein [Gammaproteobacteria bacterium]